MNAFLLLIPFLLLRFGLLSLLNKDAIRRAAYFAPVIGKEVPAYLIYQVSNIAIFVYLCFLKIEIDFSWIFYAGIIISVLGLVLCGISIINFASPSDEGFNANGLYRVSRNPMYLAYFLFFIGCGLLTQSLILGIFILIFIICSYWIILSEERWCVEKFGESYKQYMKEVRRFI